jgi:hypothetical protein
MDLPSVEVMGEQAYLVARGVRLLAIVGVVEDVFDTVVDVRQMLFEAAVESAGSQAYVPIPFLVKNPDTKLIDVGFASHGWVVDVYEWLLAGTVPDQMVSRVMGLLLGYSGDAVAQYEHWQAGQRVPTRQKKGE